MPSRYDHLADIKARLLGRIEPIGAAIHLARVKTLDVDQLPALCLYAPEATSGEPLATGTAPQFAPTVHLAIEVRVPEADGFDQAAGAIVERIKTLLFTDPVWLRRFKRYPTWRVHQYLDRRGETTFCGEVMTIQAEDRVPTVFEPVATRLGGVTATALVGDDRITTTLLAKD